MFQRSMFHSLVTYLALMALLALMGLAAAGTALRASGALPVGEPTVPFVAVAIPSLTQVPATATSDVTATPAGPPTETPRPTRTPRPTMTPRPPTVTPTPSITPTPSPTPRPTPVATDHYWLARPIAADARNRAATFYPYGSTGEGEYQLHHGVEFVNESGTPVLAAASGLVVIALNDATRLVGPPDWSLQEDGAFYGNVVVIEHDLRLQGQPVYTLYGHMDEILTTAGTRVRTGDQIGTVGSSGIALGPHLHFEVRVGENSYLATRNPQLWLVPFSGHGTIAGGVLDERGRPIDEALVTVSRVDEDEVFLYTYTYAPGPVNPDDDWGENFLLGDLPAGRWKVAARDGDRGVVAEVSVREGETSWLWLEFDDNE